MKKIVIHVIHLLAVLMLFVKNEMVLVLVLVYLNISVILISVVDLSVFSTQTVIEVGLV